MEGQEPAPKLLEQVRNAMRLHHDSIHTERSYIEWIHVLGKGARACQARWTT